MSTETAVDRSYHWINDLVERHSLSLVGPEGALAHIVRTAEGHWYAYAPSDTEPGYEKLVDHQRDLQIAMAVTYALVAQCTWPERDCDLDREAHSAYCPVHASTIRAERTVRLAPADR